MLRFVRWKQCPGESSYAVCDVGQDSPDPRRTAAVAMHHQPNPGARDRRGNHQPDQFLLPVRTKARQTRQPAAVNRRGNRGFMAAGLQSDARAGRNIHQPVLRRTLDVGKLYDQIVAGTAGLEIRCATLLKVGRLA